MKNTVKLFGARLLVCIALAALIGFAGCDTGNGPGTGSSITWTLEQVDGVPMTATTTAINITFSDAVDLTDADITIGGAASRDSSTQLSSSGNVWTVPVDVDFSDLATVTVTKTGVAHGPKTVMVFKLGETPPSIIWTAVADGRANTTTSKITFTFTPAVVGLEESDITLTAGTGSATKGELNGNGAIWTLGITVNTAGTVSVKITKDGVSAIPQDVTVYKAGGGTTSSNPVSGKTSWLTDAMGIISQIVFSAGGTYTLNGLDWGDYSGDPTWTSIEGEGSYTWDESTEIVTITAAKIAVQNTETWETVLMTQSEAELVFRNEVQAEVEYTIGTYMEEDVWGVNEDTGEWELIETITRTEQEATEYFLEMENQYKGTTYTTVNEYIDGEVARKIAASFDPRPYTHFFKGETLVLLEALPEPVGTDELAGKTFDIPGFEGISGGSVVFDATGGTFTATVAIQQGEELTIETLGSYSYNATTKQVYLKQDIIGGQTPEDFYDTTPLSEYGNYPTEADDRAAQTNQNFPLQVAGYSLNPNNLLIGGGVNAVQQR
jgi:hypothetical protein